MGIAQSKQQPEAGAQEKLTEALRALELRSEREIAEKDYIYIENGPRKSRGSCSKANHDADREPASSDLQAVGTPADPLRRQDPAVGEGGPEG